ncbi:MAG TPA: hypothetical protein VI035_07530 [Solirubrobacterales bacterium]
MADGKSADQLANQAAEAVRRVIAEAEEEAAEIVRDAEAKAASIRDQAQVEASQIRERGEADARAQIEAAKRALDELGGTLAAAASAAVPSADATPTEPEPEPEPESEPEPEPAARAAGNGDDAAERLVAMKMAVDGKDQAAIEAELGEKFGPRDRTELLKDVLSRVPR